MSSIFENKAPKIMIDLMRDFGLDQYGAAAILGNLGHESAGFRFLQEIKPTVLGSKGGYGWAQWTGPRRNTYLAYCERNHLDPASDKANYAYLFVELSDLYKDAISGVKRADTLYDKVAAFEKVYERAGVKAYSSRMAWAEKALIAYRNSIKDEPVVDKPPLLAIQPDDPGVPQPAASGFFSAFAAWLLRLLSPKE